jgi:hypothetical protein
VSVGARTVWWGMDYRTSVVQCTLRAVQSGPGVWGPPEWRGCDCPEECIEVGQGPVQADG